MKTLFLSLILVLFSTSLAAQKQDQVLLKNGDKLTGKVVTLNNGKLKFKTEKAGEITIDWDAVRSLRGTALKLILADGSILKRDVEPLENNQLQPQGGELKLPPISLSQVKTINPPAPAPLWSGDVNIGATMTTGNAETTAVNANFNLVRRGKVDRLTFNAGWLYSEQENLTTNESELTERKTFSGLKYDYFLSKKWFLNANTKAEGSEAADLDLRYTIGAGFGYQFLETEKWKVAAELGTAFLYEDFDDVSAEKYITARLANTVDWKITNTLTYGHVVEWLPSTENSKDQLVSMNARLAATVMEKMFIQFQVSMDWDNTPAPTAKKTDVTYALGVGWKF